MRVRSDPYSTPVPSSLRVNHMKWHYLEVTFRHGRPLAAYL
jgi:hypothetical protein